MKGMVAADMTMDGDTVLTHLETFERHVLRGRWSLVTSDDSDHVFVAKDGSDDVNEFHDVEDISPASSSRTTKVSATFFVCETQFKTRSRWLR